MKIGAFTDEIADDLDEQIASLKTNLVDCIELRGVRGKNVLALSEAEKTDIVLAHENERY